MSSSMIDLARSAVERGSWLDAYEAFSSADESAFKLEDHEAFALAAGMLMELEVCVDAWARAYKAWLDVDEVRAARCAFWLGLWLINQGEMARGGGWIGRATNTLPETEAERPETGLMTLPMALQALEGGDPEAALDMFKNAAGIGRRFRDADLLSIALLGVGRSLVELGRAAEGSVALDEAMVAVTADETSPFVRGLVYCGVILTCYEVFDIRRAHEWTRVLDEWTAPQQGLVPFRGQCLVHRAQIKRMHGEWADALAEAERARERLADPPGQPAIGLAYYQLGELNRERGEFDGAELAYREAHRAGHTIQPGLALLRLTQGRTVAAAAAIDTALEEAPERSAARARLLPAVVEIALAGDDLRRARDAAEELAEVAERFDAPVLRAESAAALGALRLAEGDATAARTSLRDAQQRWLELDVPYEVARTQVRLSLASAALEDDDTAALERDAARRTFTELGAGPALSALERRSSERRGGLTAREAEILKLVATGMTNKEIAEVLVISRKTVARHLSNVFTKLGLKTRAEATAYAFKHGLA